MSKLRLTDPIDFDAIAEELRELLTDLQSVGTISTHDRRSLNPRARITAVCINALPALLEEREQLLRSANFFNAENVRLNAQVGALEQQLAAAATEIAQLKLQAGQHDE